MTGSASASPYSATRGASPRGAFFPGLASEATPSRNFSYGDGQEVAPWSSLAGSAAAASPPTHSAAAAAAQQLLLMMGSPHGMPSSPRTPGGSSGGGLYDGEASGGSGLLPLSTAGHHHLAGSPMAGNSIASLLGGSPTASGIAMPFVTGPGGLTGSAGMSGSMFPSSEGTADGSSGGGGHAAHSFNSSNSGSSSSGGGSPRRSFSPQAAAAAAAVASALIPSVAGAAGLMSAAAAVLSQQQQQQQLGQGAATAAGATRSIGGVTLTFSTSPSTSPRTAATPAAGAPSSRQPGGQQSGSGSIVSSGGGSPASGSPRSAGHSLRAGEAGARDSGSGSSSHGSGSGSHSPSPAAAVHVAGGDKSAVSVLLAAAAASLSSLPQDAANTAAAAALVSTSPFASPPPSHSSHSSAASFDSPLSPRMPPAAVAAAAPQQHLKPLSTAAAAAVISAEGSGGGVAAAGGSDTGSEDSLVGDSDAAASSSDRFLPLRRQVSADTVRPVLLPVDSTAQSVSSSSVSVTSEVDGVAPVAPLAAYPATAAEVAGIAVAATDCTASAATSPGLVSAAAATAAATATAALDSPLAPGTLQQQQPQSDPISPRPVSDGLVPALPAAAPPAATTPGTATPRQPRPPHPSTAALPPSLFARGEGGRGKGRRMPGETLEERLPAILDLFRKNNVCGPAPPQPVVTSVKRVVSRSRSRGGGGGAEDEGLGAGMDAATLRLKALGSAFSLDSMGRTTNESSHRLPHSSSSSSGDGPSSPGPFSSTASSSSSRSSGQGTGAGALPSGHSEIGGGSNVHSSTPVPVPGARVLVSLAGLDKPLSWEDAHTGLPVEQFAAVAKTLCGFPSFFAAPLFRRLRAQFGGPVNAHGAVTYTPAQLCVVTSITREEEGGGAAAGADATVTFGAPAAAAAVTSTTASPRAGSSSAGGGAQRRDSFASTSTAAAPGQASGGGPHSPSVAAAAATAAVVPSEVVLPFRIVENPAAGDDPTERDVSGTIALPLFLAYWRAEMEPWDHAERFLRLVKRRAAPAIEPVDFMPFMEELLAFHPGLAFLENTPEFQEKYARTVIARIFYVLDPMARRKLDTRALRCSNLLSAFHTVDVEEDINIVNDYFSYEHFYVLYCVAEDHQILTNRGFLSLEAMQAAVASDPLLLIASYNSDTSQLVYEPCKSVIVNAAKPQTLVELTHTGEAARWGPDADPYGRSPLELATTATHGRKRSAVVAGMVSEAPGGVGSRDSPSPPSTATTGSAPAALAMHSNGVSLLVTPNHDMFARLGYFDAHGHPLWPKKKSPAATYTKMKASALLATKGNTAIKQLVSAVAGVAPLIAPGCRYPFVEALGLPAGDETALRFLEVYGFWLADGTLTFSRGSARGVSFHPVKAHDVEWLEEVLPALGVTACKSGPHGTGQQYHFTVSDAQWLAWFHGEYQTHYKAGDRDNSGAPSSGTISGAAAAAASAEAAGADEVAVDDDGNMGYDEPWCKSAKWLADFVWSLPAEGASAIISGWRRGDGGEAADQNVIYTSSVRVREQLIRLMLHAGYSATFKCFYVAGQSRGVDRWDKPIVASHEGWAVTFSTHTERSQPTLRRDRDVREVAYTGRTWCVTVPSGLIFVRRALTDATTGAVIKASRPVLTGNCKFWELDSDHDFLLSRGDLSRMSDLTHTVLDRVFAQSGRPFSSGLKDRMSYEDFIVLFLSEGEGGVGWQGIIITTLRVICILGLCAIPRDCGGTSRR